MGLFDRFSAPKHPALDAASSQAATFAIYEREIADLLEQVGNSVELVVADGVVYALVGKPPKSFGLAWFDDQGQHNLKKLAESHGLGFSAMASITERLGVAYSDNQDQPRFAYPVGKRTVTVIASDELAREIAGIISVV